MSFEVKLERRRSLEPGDERDGTTIQSPGVPARSALAQALAPYEMVVTGSFTIKFRDRVEMDAFLDAVSGAVSPNASGPATSKLQANRDT